MNVTNSRIGNGNSEQRIYINENLTPYYKTVFWKAKIRAKEIGFTFVWLRSGIIFVSHDKKSHLIRIEKEIDIRKYDKYC